MLRMLAWYLTQNIVWIRIILIHRIQIRCPILNFMRTVNRCHVCRFKHKFHSNTLECPPPLDQINTNKLFFVVEFRPCST